MGAADATEMLPMLPISTTPYADAPPLANPRRFSPLIAPLVSHISFAHYVSFGAMKKLMCDTGSRRF